MTTTNSNLDTKTRFCFAGHSGMVGSALLRCLRSGGYTELITVRRQDSDLMTQSEVMRVFKVQRPRSVFLAAPMTCGIDANKTYRADVLYNNLMIGANVIHPAVQAGVSCLMFLGSSCICPRYSMPPMSGSELLMGPVEAANKPYAIAKISGVKLCEKYNKQCGMRYVSVMPTNLNGANDNHDLGEGHVLPALLRKAHAAKVTGRPELSVWGSSKPRRGLIYLDDLVDACVILMERSIIDGLFNEHA